MGIAAEHRMERRAYNNQVELHVKGGPVDWNEWLESERSSQLCQWRSGRWEDFTVGGVGRVRRSSGGNGQELLGVHWEDEHSPTG